jgi:uncharacterized protein YegP (UPF0339 family)
MKSDSPRVAKARASCQVTAGQRQFDQSFRNEIASNDRGLSPGEDQLDPQGESHCHFEISRAHERPVSSTQFTGGDWRWCLVTSEGLILAEASGYPNEGSCRAAVTALQQRAASASVQLRTEERP